MTTVDWPCPCRAKHDLVIRTRNSEYRFTTLDPEGRLGLLSGGRLGAEQRSALLVERAGLQVGGRAVFELAADEGVRRLTTSPIHHIACHAC